MLSAHLVNQRGLSLIEILVTTLIVSIGLLGLATLQLKSMSLNQASNQRQQAINLAQDISDSIFVNALGASTGEYTITTLGTTTTIPETSVAQKDINRWVTNAALFKGDFLVNDPTSKNYQITICWRDANVEVVNSACNNLPQMDAIVMQSSRR